MILAFFSSENETKITQRKVEFTGELLKLMDDNIAVTQHILKELRAKYNLPPSAS